MLWITFFLSFSLFSHSVPPISFFITYISFPLISLSLTFLCSTPSMSSLAAWLLPCAPSSETQMTWSRDFMKVGCSLSYASLPSRVQVKSQYLTMESQYLTLVSYWTILHLLVSIHGQERRLLTNALELDLNTYFLTSSKLTSVLSEFGLGCFQSEESQVGLEEDLRF